jgi:predicted dehydrogenase
MTPLKAETARKRFGFRVAGTSVKEALADTETQVVFIATRHDTHARFVEAALVENKAVFVEKPLALTRGELDRIVTAVRATQARLMVGFNRRFAPAIRWALETLGQDRVGLRFLARVNAGPLPANHWLLDPSVGGGRLLGEGCHFLDLACFVAGSDPVEVDARALDNGRRSADNQDFRIAVAFANGSTAAIDYLSGGDPSLPKERFEIHRAGTSITIDDFRRAERFRAGRRQTRKWAAKDRGHRAEVHAFLDAVRTGGPTPIPEEESLRSTELTLAAARSAREGRPLRLAEW